MAASTDNRRWFLKVSDETVYGSVTTRTLILWAEQGCIHPGHLVSHDHHNWIEAAQVPELEMAWCIVDPQGQAYGPLNRVAAERLLAENRFEEGSTLSLLSELPVPEMQKPHFLSDQVYPPDSATAERNALLANTSDLQAQNVLLQSSKDELEKQLAASSEVIHHLNEELETEKRKNAEFQHAFEEQLERATLLDKAHEQRRSELEHNQPPTTPIPPSPHKIEGTAELYTILTQESALLERFAEQELRLIEEIKRLSQTRRKQYSERLQAIRSITGGDPAEMRRKAQRENRPYLAADYRTADNQDYRQLIKEANEREAELHRNLQTFQTREVHLRKQLDEARNHAGSTLELQSQIQLAEQALEQERAARQNEQKEAERIQERLMTRIEELEQRLNPSAWKSRKP